VVPSNLSKNRYSPLHGTFWNHVLNGRIRDRNPIGCDNELPAFATSTSKLQKQDLVEQPDPRWSIRKVGDWIQRQIRDGDDLAIHSLKQCVENANGLYPVFDSDAFGIKGTSGLTQWIVDSGATSHCTSDISTFTTLSRDVPFNKIKVANGKSVKVAGVGDAVLHIVDSKNPKRNIKLTLKNVLFIPEIPVNLISTRALWNDGGIKTTFADSCTPTFKSGGTVSFNTGKQGHYYCVAKTRTADDDPATPVGFGASLCAVCEPDVSTKSASETAAFSTHVPTSDVVHARLGHCGPERAVEALRRSTGLPELPHYRKDLPAHCDSCRTGGARKTPLHGIPAPFRPKAFGDRIHSDLCGPFPTSVTGKFEYILCFVDNFTGYSEIFFLQIKLSSEVKPHFERFVKKWRGAASALRWRSGRMVGSAFRFRLGTFNARQMLIALEEVESHACSPSPACSNSLHAQRSASQLQVSAIHEGAKGEKVIWEFRHRCAPSCAVLSLIKRSAAPCRRQA